MIKADQAAALEGKVVRVERTRRPLGALVHASDMLEGVVKHAMLGAKGELSVVFEEDEGTGAGPWPASSTDWMDVVLTVVGHKNGTVAFIDVHDHIGGKYVGGPAAEPVARDVVAIRSGDRWLPVNQRVLDPMGVSESLVPDECVSNVRPIGAMPR
jgi:hypothetical protein